VRRAALVQFSASRVDSKFEELQLHHVMGRRRRSSSKKDTSDVAQRVTRFVGGASGRAETAPPWSPSSHCCSATSSTGNGGPHEPELRLAMVTWIERTYRRRRRRRALGQLTAIEFELLHTPVATAV